MSEVGLILYCLLLTQSALNGIFITINIDVDILINSYALHQCTDPSNKSVQGGEGIIQVKSII